MKYFDKTVCLCCDKRIVENCISIDAELAKYDIIVERFIAGDGKTLSHYDYIDEYIPEAKRSQYYNHARCIRKIVEQAKSENVQKLLLLEDDAVLTPDFSTRFPLTIAEAESIKYDAFFLGGVHWNGVCYNIEGKNHLILPTFSADMHAIILCKSIFDDILAIPDCFAQPFDLYFSKLQQSKIIIAANPSLIVQKYGISLSSGIDHKWMGRYNDISIFYPERETVKLC